MPQRPDDPAADASGHAADDVWEDLVARLRGMGGMDGAPGATGGGAGTAPAGASSGGPAATSPDEASDGARGDDAAGTPPAVGPAGLQPRTVRPARRAPGDDAAGAGGRGTADAPVPAPLPGADGRSWDATDRMDAAERRVDEAERFVPPDPGPVLGGEPLRTAAWLAVVGAPLLVVVALVAWPGAPASVLQAAGVVFLLGIAVLVWRMPHRRDPDDPDDGAVV
ncbi:hypothetical protein [Cellulomonas marina]|uniref:DUF308 domain-containing protein n=1 Tax=Cellulomonas marina TaxID=988821 RepID=A0A1I0W118_9CELL|nr:hypothetical protein [Cellulomonas marina]GIG27416.1 hypothetical protein Cma02nite_00160 [Cellulomonas marina]SFA82224.1 hypothetical protein SAMN05421867_10298 [Cellulomonas marina]